MASKFSRVNGRSHRTIDQRATCKECKRAYNNWKFIGADERCYKCHGVDEQDNAALIAFIADNQSSADLVVQRIMNAPIAKRQQEDW